MEKPTFRTFSSPLITGSIGTSIFYTSVTSIVGFGALAVSEFRPNAYFGILTGLAMVAALFAMLTLLPTLAWAVGLFARGGKST